MSSSAFPVVGFGILGLVFVGVFGLFVVSVLMNLLVGDRQAGQASKTPQVAPADRTMMRGFKVLLAFGLGLAVVAGMAMLGVRLFHERQARQTLTLNMDLRRSAQAAEDAAARFQEARSQLRNMPGPFAEVLTTAADSLQALSDARQEAQQSVQEPEIPLEEADIRADVVAASQSDGAAAEAPETPTAPAADIKSRQAELLQIATMIGQSLRARLEQDREKSTGGSKSATATPQKDVVVFQVPEAMVGQILGESGRELLRSFNSELPGGVRQTYALVPLTPPVGSPVSPLPPLIPGRSLTDIASSLISLVDIVEPAAGNVTADSPVVLATAPELRPMPEWVRHPDGRRIVAETESLLEGDDPAGPLLTAINKALGTHLESVTASTHPALRDQVRTTSLELSPETARTCIVEEYERVEVMETTVEGPKSIRKYYALLEFPESIDQAALGALRQSVQRERIGGMAAVIACAWLSIVSTGFGVQLWRRGTRLRRMVAVPILTVVAVPLAAAAVGLTAALSSGTQVMPAWSQTPSTIHINMADDAV